MKNASNFLISSSPTATKSVFRLLMLALIFTAAVSCNAQKPATETAADTTKRARPERGQQPSLDQIFAMDANKDGKLAKSEVKGPLAQDFAKIDTDQDGFLSRKEVENAPKPQRGQRPQRNK